MYLEVMLHERVHMTPECLAPRRLPSTSLFAPGSPNNAFNRFFISNAALLVKVT